MTESEVTVVLTVEPILIPSLLVGTGSPALEVAEAVLVNDPLAGAFTVTVKLVVSPYARLGSAGNSAVWSVDVPPALALTKATTAGRLSLTTTLLAVEGPRLVTVMV